MRITRLLIDGDGTTPPLTVDFDRLVSVFDCAPADLSRLRRALTLLLSGSTEFGSARLEIDGIEIDAGREIVAHFKQRLAARNAIVDPALLARNQTPTDTAANVALRAALELRHAIEPQLDVRTVEAALQAVIAEKQVLLTEAKVAEVEAQSSRQDAIDALAKIDHWSGNIRRAHKAAEEARAASRKVTGLFSHRAYTRLREEEFELLRAGNFENYDDFLTYSAVTQRDYTQQLEQAELDLITAQKTIREIEAGANSSPRAQALTVQEYALRSARGVLHADRELTAEDHASLDNALAVMVDLARADEGPSTAAHTDSVSEAVAWLGRIEGEHVRAHLERQLIVNADPLPILGTVPVVVDNIFDDLSPAATNHVLSVLEPYVGQVQIIVLGANHEVGRWLTAQGI